MPAGGVTVFAVTVRGREKVLVYGQVEVLAGGQL